MATFTDYRFSADTLRAIGTGRDPAKKNMGILEVFLEQFGNSLGAAKGLATIALAGEVMDLPSREVGREQLNHLNGSWWEPTRPEALGEMTITFKDFIGSAVNARTVMEDWFSLVTYDEESGFMLPSSQGKTEANWLTFGSNGAIARIYSLEGIWPMNAPKQEGDHSSGEMKKFDVRFSVDSVKRSWVEPSPL